MKEKKEIFLEIKIFIFIFFLVIFFFSFTKAYDDAGGYFICYNCSDCMAALNDTTYNVVKLGADITDHQGNCIDYVENFYNKIFDCQGHVIDGDWEGQDYAIHLKSYRNNNTIKNCIIQEFYHGIFFFNIANLSIINNTFRNLNQTGIHGYSNQYNITIENNTFFKIYDAIRSNNDLKGAVIKNNNFTSQSMAQIFIGNGENIEIANNFMDKAVYGTYATLKNSYIRNNSVSGNSNGIQVQYSKNVTVENNIAFSNYRGSVISHSEEIYFRNNSVFQNGLVGIWFINVSNSVIENNVAYNDNKGGIFIYYNSLNVNVIENNVYNNTNGIVVSNCDPFDSCGSYGNNNIFVSENKVMNNGIGIKANLSNLSIYLNVVCDNTNYDFYAENWENSVGDENYCRKPDGWNDEGTTGCTYVCPCFCSSCQDCVAKINTVDCLIIMLNSNIANVEGSCINNPESFSNKIFDCQKFSISGKKTANSSAIYIKDKENITLRNCKISNFYYGVHLSNSSFINFFNNVLRKNEYGLYLIDSFDLNISNNSICYNTNYDVYANNEINGTSNTCSKTFNFNCDFICVLRCIIVGLHNKNMIFININDVCQNR